MLPSIDPVTGNLPPGAHESSWTELEAAFGTTRWRRQLLSGLRAALEITEELTYPVHERASG